MEVSPTIFITLRAARATIEAAVQQPQPPLVLRVSRQFAEACLGPASYREWRAEAKREGRG